MIYRKSLRLSNGEKAGRATGDIVNLQSVDAVRIGDLAQYGHIGWSGPFQVSHQTDGRDAPPLTSHRSCSRSFRLYNLVGWQAFMGVGIMMISVSYDLCRRECED